MVSLVHPADSRGPLLIVNHFCRIGRDSAIPQFLQFGGELTMMFAEKYNPVLIMNYIYRDKLFHLFYTYK